MTADDYIHRADETLRETYEPPMDISAYVETIFENPTSAAHASKYLLAAIEAVGTRTVIEEGEKKERYRFFDDPHNDGQHAILGNTDVLNDFVTDLRSIAARRGKEEKILWIDGPTATGKSELKRCLVNGLREFSKTEEGRRYTVEWNIAATPDVSSGMTYGDRPPSDEDDWYPSPVQSHPLSVFPEPVRNELLAELNETHDDHIPIHLETRLDPFSYEAYAHLEEQYRRQRVNDLFSAVTDTKHLRVKNFVVDVGRGIGVLHSEDDGSPKERLVGSWMAGMLQQLDSRGRKNPQAFSYDGVLSQGNGLLTIVEDAAQHADLLQKLLNIPDEKTVKLDKGIGMDIDTQIIIISNPDLEAQLNRHAEAEGSDPLKALKRRLDKHEFSYLTNLSLEAELVHRELTNETAIWDVSSYDEIDEIDEKIREPLVIPVRHADTDIHDRELAPHTVEAAALYAVVTRLDADSLPSGLDIVDKALIYDRGYLQDGDERLDKDEFDFAEATDGAHGIPITFTRDIIADLLYETTDRHHQTLNVEDVIMPRDVLNEMVSGLDEAPMFSTSERTEYEARVVPVKQYVFSQQEADVIDAIMREKQVDEETVETYLEHVYAWVEDETIENDRGESIQPDALKMKVFEIEHLGRFDEADYDGTDPNEEVVSFRSDRVITALNRHAWQSRDENFRASDVDLHELPIIESVLGSYDWNDVKRTYEDLSPTQWADPPSGTETESVKARTIENMQELFGYSAASAELTSRYVMEQINHRWN